MPNTIVSKNLAPGSTPVGFVGTVGSPLVAIEDTLAQARPQPRVAGAPALVKSTSPHKVAWGKKLSTVGFGITMALSAGLLPGFAPMASAATLSGPQTVQTDTKPAKTADDGGLATPKDTDDNNPDATLQLTLGPSNFIKDSDMTVQVQHVDAILHPKNGTGAVVEMEDGTMYGVTNSYDSLVHNDKLSKFIPVTLDSSNAIADTNMVVNPDHLSAVLQPSNGQGSVVAVEDGHKYHVIESYDTVVKSAGDLKLVEFGVNPVNGFEDTKISINQDLEQGVLHPTSGQGAVIEMTDGGKWLVNTPYSDVLAALAK